MNQTIFLTPEKREAQKLAQLRTRERKQELTEKNAAKNRHEGGES